MTDIHRQILLNYLPFDQRDQWSEILVKQRRMYDSFVQDLLKEPTTTNASDHVNSISLNS